MLYIEHTISGKPQSLCCQNLSVSESRQTIVGAITIPLWLYHYPPCLVVKTATCELCYSHEALQTITIIANSVIQGSFEQVFVFFLF